MSNGLSYSTDPFGMFSRSSPSYSGGYANVASRVPAYTPMFSSGGGRSDSDGGGGGGGLLGANPYMAFAGDVLKILTAKPEERTSVDFSKKARQNFTAGTRISDEASEKIRRSLEAMGAQRYQALQQDLDAQIGEARNIGLMNVRDINAAYNAQQGKANQGLISSGLFNTTVAPGMRAMVERERANSLTRARGQQAQLMTGLLGQRASALAQERSALDSALANILGSDYQIRAGLATQLSQPDQVRKRSGGILG